MGVDHDGYLFPIKVLATRKVYLIVLWANATNLLGCCIPGANVLVSMAELLFCKQLFGLHNGSLDSISVVLPKDGLSVAEGTLSLDDMFDFGGHPWFVCWRGL